MKKLLLSILVMPLMAMELQRIDNDKIMKLNGTFEAELYRDQHGFQVNDHGEFKRIKSHRLNDAIRKLRENPEAMEHFLKNKDSYLKLSKNEDGDYALDADGRVIGGGPIASYWAYTITKAAMYGTALCAGTAAVAGAVAASGGNPAVAMAGTYALKTAAAGATMGTSVAAAGVATTVGAANAGLATAGVLASSGGSVAAATGFVETCSLAVGAFFFWLPLP